MIDLLPPRSRVAFERASARDLATPGSRAPALDALDALLLVVDAARPGFGALPHGPLLAAEHARRPRSPGGSYALSLPNARRTRVHVGLLAPEATPFDSLALAGRLARALPTEAPAALGLAAALPAARADTALEALASAVLAAARPAPRATARPAPAWRPERVLAFGAPDLARTVAMEDGAALVRWLTALPPNVLTPGAYRRAVRRLARARGWVVREYDERALARLGCGAFLAVVQGGAARDAALVRVSYRPRAGRGRAPLALVGKGLCYDTGGTNLKPAKSMFGMHTDMSGSAVTLGILDALTTLRFPRPVDAWLAIAENRIGPNAYKPNDVVRAANGTTIEVVHSDAEGRMVLADALALAARERPAAIVDFATLTGACVNALTERYSGVFANRPRLRAVLEAAGAAAGERVWGFPTPSDYDEELESPVADVVQCLPDGKGDHLYAARFLGRFVPAEIPWAHVDLSSVHRTGGLAHVNSPVTGFGVRFGTTLLLDHADALADPPADAAAPARPRRPRRSTPGSR